MSNTVKATDYRNQFRTYLLQDKFSSHGCDVYINLLSSVVDFYIQVLADLSHKTVFEVTDVNLLTKYHSILMQDRVFVSLNRSKGKRPESAFLKYIGFIKKLDLANTHKTLGTSLEGISANNEIKPQEDHSAIRARQTDNNQRQRYIKKAQFIIRPIEEYLNEYQLASIIAFEYINAFRDVDVIRPRFNNDLETVTRELGELVSLMTKYNLQIPLSIRRRQEIASEQKELRDTVRAFENWIVGYMTYLSSGEIEVESVSYFPDSGFRIDLTGKGITPISISMKTSIATTMAGTVSVRKKKQ